MAGGPAAGGRRPLGPDRPVVVASSGNFGQGVAYAARAAGVGAVVFCDAAFNPVKAVTPIRASTLTCGWSARLDEPRGVGGVRPERRPALW